MSESKTKSESLREWMVEHKLRAVGVVWLTGIVGSIAYQWSSPKKFQVKVIHSSWQSVLLTDAIYKACSYQKISSDMMRSLWKQPLSVASASLSSPSYAQMIPTIPKPAPLQDHRHHCSFSSSFKYQSAPVNIPVLMRKKYELEAIADEEDDDGEMLPPHKILARSSAHSPMVVYSVLEGMGRTLKGRDLRWVRNAVWRRTGFLN